MVRPASSPTSTTTPSPRFPVSTRSWACPTTMKIEHLAVGHAQLLVETGNRGDGVVVDVGDEAGRTIEALVRLLVHPLEEPGREGPIAGVGVGAQRSASARASTQRTTCAGDHQGRTERHHVVERPGDHAPLQHAVPHDRAVGSGLVAPPPTRRPHLDNRPAPRPPPGWRGRRTASYLSGRPARTGGPPRRATSSPPPPRTTSGGPSRCSRGAARTPGRRLKRLVHRRPEHDPAEWHIPRGHALGERDEVGPDPVVLAAEPVAQPAPGRR